MAGQRTVGRHEVVADVAPDALYVELKLLTQGPGRAWIANLELVP